MTFIEYLRSQKKRDDPVGDFARDVCADKSRSKPRGPSNLYMWESYLERKGASKDAGEALRQAWEEYTTPKIEGACHRLLF